MREQDPACWSWKPPGDSDLERLRQRMDEDAPGLANAMEEDYLRWVLMGDWHEERCAICGFRCPQPVTDHDHETGLIRGFLCRACNIAEGRSNSPILVKYRERPPAVICGVRQLYSRGW